MHNLVNPNNVELFKFHVGEDVFYPMWDYYWMPIIIPARIKEISIPIYITELEQMIWPEILEGEDKFTILFPKDDDFIKVEDLPEGYTYSARSPSYWIDEPIGHGISDDELSTTLYGASQKIPYFRKRGTPQRMFERWRQRRKFWLEKGQFNGKEPPENWGTIEYDPNKPVYYWSKSRKLRYKDRSKALEEYIDLKSKV